MLTTSATERLSITEAAVLTGRDNSILELAMRRGELRYVLSGSRRAVRTSPGWVSDWLRRGRR